MYVKAQYIHTVMAEPRPPNARDWCVLWVNFFSDKRTGPVHGFPGGQVPITGPAGVPDQGP